MDSFTWQPRLAPARHHRGGIKTLGAAAAITLLESLLITERNWPTVSLPYSSQQLVDNVWQENYSKFEAEAEGFEEKYKCSTIDALHWLMGNRVVAEEEYPNRGPFNPRTQSPEHAQYSRLGVTARTSERVIYDEESVRQLVRTRPVGASMVASPKLLDLKAGEIYEGHVGTRSRGRMIGTQLDVVIIGFDRTPDGRKCWLLRSSLGPEFGDGGDFKALMDSELPSERKPMLFDLVWPTGLRADPPLPMLQG